MGIVLAFQTAGRQAPARHLSAGPRSLLMEPAALPGDLVRRIQAGDRQAEGELVEHYGEGLAFLLRRWTRDQDAASDLYQETFRLALEKIRRGEVRDPDRLPAQPGQEPEHSLLPPRDAPGGPRGVDRGDRRAAVAGFRAGAARQPPAAGEDPARPPPPLGALPGTGPGDPGPFLHSRGGQR